MFGLIALYCPKQGAIHIHVPFDLLNQCGIEVRTSCPTTSPDIAYYQYTRAGEYHLLQISYGWAFNIFRLADNCRVVFMKGLTDRHIVAGTSGRL